jgi:DNA (cytosine-5)-methyltransferase 1
MLTVGSLFTGIGGLDLGLERAGMRVLWQSEIDPYCCEVLAKHWPEVPNLGDVTAINWQAVQPVDVICGGYPCQPFSLAGARKGTTDERHLWPYFANAIRVLRPRFALLENVAGHLTLGFGEVLRALAEIGYDAQWDCVPAAAVGAPHRRDRLFVVAYPNGDGKHDGAVDAEVASAPQPLPDGDGELRIEPLTLPGCGPDDVADADVEGSQGHRRSLKPARELNLAEGGAGTRTAELADAEGERRERAMPAWASRGQGRVPEGRGARMADADGTPRRSAWSTSETVFRPPAVERSGRRGSRIGWPWAVEPDVGRVAYGIPRRVDRLRALGNAVVPQVAEHLGQLIYEHERRMR